jgi:hypothetical protein
MDVNVGPIPTYRPEISGFVGVEIDEIKRVERRSDLQRARRTALDGDLGLLRDVNAGAAETVDVIFLEVGGPGESLGVGGTVLFDDLELELPEKSPMNRAPRYGARTRSGNLCQSPAVRGKRRCRMHGGAASSGAPTGNTNALNMAAIPRKPSRGGVSSPS